MMKRLFTLASLLLAAVSCSESEVDPSTPGSENQRIVLSASTAEGTRVGFEDQDAQGVKVTWAENDELSFYDAEGQLVGDFRLLEGSGKTSAKFEQVGAFSLMEGAMYTVVYPKVAGATSLALYNRILSVQTQDGNAPMSHMDKLMRMEQKEYVYTKSAPEVIAFLHSYAMMTLTLGTPANYVAGTDGAPKEMILYVSNTAYNLSLTNVAWDSAIKTYVMIEPTTKAEKMRVEVITSADKVYTASFDASKAYAAGKRYAKTLDQLRAVTSYTLATIGNLPTTATEVVVTDVIVGRMNLFTLMLALQRLTGPASLMLPNALEIGKTSFSGCTNLTSVSLPKVTKIEENAFSGCNGLRSMSLPVVETIGNGAFSGCALTSVSLSEAVTIGEGAFASCSSLTSVNLPLVATIEKNTFQNCDALTSVSLPLAATIGEEAFGLCDALASVSLPAATTIGEGAFWHCQDLSSVNFPVAETIGPEAFISCQSLRSMSLPVAKTIGMKAFFECPILASVSLPKAERIESFALASCPVLASVNLPYVEYIGDKAFNATGSTISAGEIVIATKSTYDVTAESVFTFDENTTKYDLVIGWDVTGIDVDTKTWTLNARDYKFKSITVKKHYQD